METKVPYKKPRILPPVWLTISIAAIFALDHWLPIAQITPRLTHLSAWLLLVPGLLCVVMPGLSFFRAKTGIVPFSDSTTLIKTGLYRVSRNPIYLGMVLILAGLAWKLGTLAAWIPVVLFALIIHREFVLKEEAFLLNIYGDQYREYMRRVRRWI